MLRHAMTFASLASASAALLLWSVAALAFDPVVIKGVSFVSGLPLPAHHGILAKIAPIENPNLTAFKVLVSADGGKTWLLYDNAIRPYNAEVITLLYRGRSYALATGVDYKIKICAVYGTAGEECSETSVKLPAIADNRNLDEDGDKLSREFEYNRGLDPWNPDSDNDDISDRAELAYALDPNLAQFPELQLALADVPFGTGDPHGDGPEQHQSVVMRNVGSRPLRLFDVLLESTPKGVFLASNNFKMISQIPPGDEVAVDVDFLPRAPGAAAGEMILLTDDRKRFPATVKVGGTGQKVANMFIELPQSGISFGRTQAGAAPASILLPVRNIESDQPLKVSAHIEGAMSYLVTPELLTVPPGEKGEFRIIFSPDWSGTHEGVLRVQGTNDAAFSVALLPIAGAAEGDPPEARLSTGLISFPPTRISSASEQHLSIINDGDGWLFVKEIDLGASEGILPGFGAAAVFTPSSHQLAVPPHSNRPLKVTFRPRAAVPYASQLCIVTNDPAVGISGGCDAARTVSGMAPLPKEALRVILEGEGRP